MVEGAEGQEGWRCIENDEKGVMGRTIGALGWARWKKVYVRYAMGRHSVDCRLDENSFRNEYGRFGEPECTIPDLDDEDANDAGE